MRQILNKTYHLGFMSYCSHDPSAAIVELSHSQNGFETSFIHFEEGMLSRRKKSYHFPTRSIAACLDYFGIEIERVDSVTTDYMDLESFTDTSHNYRQLIGDYIRKNLRISPEQITNPIGHHQAHALGAWIGSKYEDAAFLAIDGLGSSQATHTIFTSENGQLKKVFAQTTPGIGQLYSLVTQLIGFKAGEEGKVMGLAPFGATLQSKYNFPKIDFKGIYKGLSVDYSRVINRSPDLHLIQEFGFKSNKLNDLYDDYRAYLAFEVQKELERCLQHLAKEIYKITKKTNLCLSGGVALNCVANETLVNANIFEKIYVFPDSADSGLSVGLAFSGALENLQKIDKNLSKTSKKYFKEKNHLLEILRNYEHPKFSPEKAVPTVTSKSFEDLPWVSLDLNIISEELIKNSVISLFNGGSEYGPRALGRRSFIASASSIEMKEILNKKIKHREPYRPFAPICLPEDFSKYFLSKHLNHEHMSYAVAVTKEAKSQIPAIVHVDDTARPQIVNKDCGIIYEILENYKKFTGCGVLVNTSLNDNDEPIVLDAYDALSCFIRTNSDLLIINEKMLFKRSIQDSLDSILVNLESEISKRNSIRFNNSLKKIMRPDVSSMSNFLVSNSVVTRYHKEFNTQNRLRNLIVDIRMGRKALFNRLVTTSTEFEVINQNLNEMKYSIRDLANDVILIELSSKILQNFKDGDLLISYNISNLFRDYVGSNKNFKLEVKNFYNSSDFPLRKPDSRVSPLEHFIDKVANTYENNLNYGIEDFFSGPIEDF